MRTRYAVRCEWRDCKEIIPFGAIAVRYAKRLYHPECLIAYRGSDGFDHIWERREAGKPKPLSVA